MESTRRLPGLLVTERTHSVPLDHAEPSGARISVFTREIAAPDGTDRPMLLYLEGGPGFEAPRPARAASSPSWLARALQDFRVVMMDQRGTGRSSPVGSLLAGSGEQQAGYLSHFRADSIVADAELVRREMGVERWSVLGQSFGGFCTLAYLSIAPEGLREALFAGGLPALGPAIDEVYRATYGRMRERCELYYARYPDDRERVTSLRERLQREPLALPGGDLLTPMRLSACGIVLGTGEGFETLHGLLELDPDSAAFRHDVEQMTSHARNPIYAVLHESCWADGGSTRWSAARMLEEQDSWLPEHLLGEHVMPALFEEQRAMRPLAAAAAVLAEQQWPGLYDASRLACNEVPAAAVIYADDVYVERVFSERTASAVRGLRTWLTSEYDHDGLKQDGERVLGMLLDLARGRV